MSQRSKSLKRLKDLNDAELAKEADELRRDVWKLKLQQSTGQAADSTKLALKRRELARALTLIRQRETSSAK